MQHLLRRALVAASVVPAAILAVSNAGGAAVETNAMPVAPLPTGADTVFVLNESVPLDVAAAAARASGAQLIAFEHDGETRGGFYTQLLGVDDAVSFYGTAYAARHGGSTPQVFAMRLAGDIPTSALGSLAGGVLTRAGIDATDTVIVTPASSGGGVVIADDDNKTVPASVPAGKKPWTPEYGFSTTYNNTGQCFPGIISCAEARGADLYLTFDRETPGNEFAADWAYEHDFKLYNENNWNTEGACPANQRNDFWADREAGIAWDTTMPDPYLDTAVSDNCRYHDLTIGSYNPDKFVRRTYDINLVIAPGDHSTSEYQLRAEALDKDCEYSPWCVGIRGFRDGQLLVGTTFGHAPGCRRWTTGLESTSC